MKKAIIVFLVFSFLISVLCSCTPGNINESRNDKESDSSFNSDLADISESDNISEEKDPDLLYSIYRSDLIVKGKVTKFISKNIVDYSAADSKYSESTKTGEITKYMLEIEEIVKGNTDGSNSIVIFTDNDTASLDNDIMSRYNVIYEELPFELELGMEGYFCLESDNRFSEENGSDYLVVNNGRGVFDLIDDNGLYHSTAYTVNPDDFPDLISEADAMYSD